MQRVALALEEAVERQMEPLLPRPALQKAAAAQERESALRQPPVRNQPFLPRGPQRPRAQVAWVGLAG